MKRTCKQCGREFELTDSQIAWYQEKGLQIPKRCEDCRAENKSKRTGRPTEEEGVGNATIDSSATTNKADTTNPTNTSTAPAKRFSSKIVGALAAAAIAVVVGFGAGAAGTSGTDTASSPSNTGNTPAATSAVQQAEQTNYKFRSNKQQKEHFEKHGKAMGYQSAKDYVAGANAVVSNPNSLHKTEKEDGDDVYYLQATDEIVIVSTDGYLRTYFNPGGIDYFYRQ